jgi:peroxin-19
MMKEITGGGGLGDLAAFGGAAGPSAPKPSASTAVKDAAGGESFQETIKKTMEKIQQSGDQATAAATEAGDNDILSELMKQLQSGGLEGDGSEEDLSKLLLGMMEQLTNKDILYEPMKELNDKFGPWMEKNKSKTDAKDLERYEKQQKIVKEIVDKFEETGYSDDNVESREYIVERMQLVSS